MSTSGNIPMQTIKPIPHWLVLTLCWLFAILYGVWILPETVFIRHFCLVTGAILSLYVIYPNRRLLLTKEAAPIWLIALLMIWVTFHLFFVGRDFNAQWDEYTRIWKKIAVGTVFAIGLGIALLSQANNQKHTNHYWRIVYLGFLLPAMTYFIKLGATTLGPKYGVEVPIYLMLDPDHMGSRFGISRAWYVFFCLPAVALSIGVLSMHIKNKTCTFSNTFIYLAVIPITLFIFYIENDRLGTFFGFALVVIALIYLGFSLLKNHALLGSIIFLLAISLSTAISFKSYQQNPHWLSLLADAKVAIKKLDTLDNWRYNRSQLKGYPLNELGGTVSISNYERISWALVGSRYALQDPLGYGLLSLSFGALDKERKKDSEMSWSHSAWLDFTLGYGLPGLLLLAAAVLIAWTKSKESQLPWLLIGRWTLPILSAVFLVKEISSEVFISAFIFLIVLVATLGLKAKLSPYPVPSK